MSDTDFRTATTPSSSPGTGASRGGSAGHNESMASNIADRGSAAVSSLSSQAQRLMSDSVDRQIDAGLGIVDALAHSIHVAADDVQKSSPQIADFMHMGGERLEDIARDFRGQSIDDIARRASQFSRANPALVFGAAFLGGLVVTRLLAGTAPAFQDVARTAMSQARDAVDQAREAVTSASTTSKGSESRHGT